VKDLVAGVEAPCLDAGNTMANVEALCIDAGNTVANVELLCLDAGNTVIFLDHERLGRLLGGIEPDVLVRAEGEAKRLAESGGLVDVDWTYETRPGAAAWGRMVATIAVSAGVPRGEAGRLLDVVWRDHEVKNLWWKVPPGLGEALDEIRALGVKVAIISNSEGMLERLFRELDVLRHFDRVVDSGIVGFEKPDPRIFRVAFDAFGIEPAKALHLGDVFATDILGARAAGCRYGLVDPYGHYEGLHPDVPRVPGATEVARAIAAERKAGRA
jgi:putative hydrolase of the HAD superfamily